MNREELIHIINNLIEKLEHKTEVKEASDGWNDEIKWRVASYFQDVRSSINKEEKVEHVGIVRSLDFDGVCRGELICDIAHSIKWVREYNQKLG